MLKGQLFLVFADMRHEQWSAMQQQRGYGPQTGSPMPPNSSSMAPQVGNLPPNSGIMPSTGQTGSGNMPPGMRPSMASSGSVDGGNTWKPGMPNVPPGGMQSAMPSTPSSYSGMYSMNRMGSGQSMTPHRPTPKMQVCRE